MCRKDDEGPSTLDGSSLLRCSKDILKNIDYINVFIPWRGSSHGSDCVVLRGKQGVGVSSLLPPYGSGNRAHVIKPGNKDHPTGPQ